MTTFISGTIIAKQLGALNIPINDAPYTIANTIGLNCPGTNNGLRFAQGSRWPLLWNEAANFASPAGYIIPTKINAAIPGLLAPTLIATGVQDGANGMAPNFSPNGTQYTPCYEGGFLGLCQSQMPSVFTFGSIPAPLGVGSLSFPWLNLTTTVNSSLAQNSQTYVCNYQGNTCFCMQYMNGVGNQLKFLIFNLNGTLNAEVTTTAGPYLIGLGTLSNSNPLIIQPYNGSVRVGGQYYNVANVGLACRNASFASSTERVIFFFDKNMECLSMSILQLDNPTYQTLWASGGYSPGNNAQTVSGGWIISINQNYPSNIVPATYFFLSADGSSWAPINIIFQGPQAQKQSNLWSRSTLTIDPTGVAWFAQALSTDASKIYIGNSFGFNFQLPIPYPFNLQNVPPFNLPCFIPCDITAVKKP